MSFMISQSRRRAKKRLTARCKVAAAIEREYAGKVSPAVGDSALADKVETLTHKDTAQIPPCGRSSSRPAAPAAYGHCPQRQEG